MNKDIGNSQDDIQTEASSKSHTIFDDVFRTMAEEAPFLLIPLINEVFKTEYTEDQKIENLKNEHYEKFGKIITDSLIRIGEHLYHIECQSKKDGDITLRMVEYDFAIAMEYSTKMENGIINIDFPESCVIYIRNHEDMPDYHEARIRFADGQTVAYKVPVFMVQDYTIDNIFEKRLLALLPYYIMRYEYFLKSGGKNQKKLEMLLNDYQKIDEKIQEVGNENRSYVDLIEWIKRIADYIIPEGNPIRERIDTMGGQLLKLKSEELREEGKFQELYSLVQDGDMTPERTAKRLQIPVSELRKRMLENGYRFPEI